MEVHYKLNEQEIKNIIAEHFHTSHKNVTLNLIPTLEWYGLNEEIKNYIEADIYYIVKNDKGDGNGFD